ATGLGPISGLAFDEPSGIMYGIEGGPGPADLVTIDLTKGKATVVGTTGIQAGSLQFGPDGSLFAGTTGFGGGKLYRIDPTSGAATLVGSTGFNRVTGLTLVDPLPPTDCVNFEHQSEVNLAINGAPCGPPIADAGADSQTECTSLAGGLVLLDGSGSVDFNSTPGTNDDIVLFEWFENFGSASQTLLETGEQVEVTLPLGPHEITLRVTDSFGDSSVDTLVVEVIDTTPPEIMLTLTPSELWPPNHRLVKVSASAVGSDNCGDPSILLTTVISSEPDDAPGGGDGATVEDIQDAMLGTADLEFRLRAERSGIGAGRIYSIVYTASDQSGNSVGVTGRVTVPHSRGGVVDPVELSVRESTSGTVVEWTDAVGALYYNVVRGEVSQVVDTGPQIDLGSVHCIESRSLNLDTTGSEDSEMPPPGNAFFYLVEYSDGALSSYGSASVNKPRVVISGACQ
ncbi:MAG: hypothetical protein ACE5HU_02275, partial [Acidobacteriota bacterium]